MVDSITSYSRNGVRDWLVQRLTAIVIAVYSIIILTFLFSHSPVKLSVWQGFFGHQTIKIFSLLAVFSIVLHSWIGMWTVYTDYVKSSAIRLLLQSVTVLALLSLLIWSAVILWG